MRILLKKAPGPSHQLTNCSDFFISYNRLTVLLKAYFHRSTTVIFFPPFSDDNDNLASLQFGLSESDWLHTCKQRQRRSEFSIERPWSNFNWGLRGKGWQCLWHLNWLKGTGNGYSWTTITISLKPARKDNRGERT